MPFALIDGRLWSVRIVQKSLADPGTSRCLQFIGSAKDVLFVGSTSEHLLEALDARGCDVTCLLVGPHDADEARVFCSTVESASADATTLPDVIKNRAFDAVIFDGALERLADPWKLLLESRAVLRADGCAIAVIPNVRYGAVRLALIKGTRPSSWLGGQLPGFTIEAVEEAFECSGYTVEQLDRARRPIFDPSDDAYDIERSDFPKSVVDAIESEPDADVYAFVLRAYPRLSGAPPQRALAPVADVAPRVTSLEAAPQSSTIGDTVSELERLLEAERITQQELLSALADAQKAAETLESRVLELSSRRQDRLTELDEARAAALQLEDAWFDIYRELERSREESRDLENTIGEQASALGRFESELDALRRDRTRERRDGQQALADARLALANAQRDHEAVRAALRDTQEHSEENDKALSIAKVRAALSESKLAELESQVTRGSDYAGELSQQLADKGVEISRVVEHADNLRRELAESGLRIREATERSERLAHENSERDGMLEAVRQAALSEKRVMRDYADEFRKRAEHAEAAHADAIRQRDEMYLRVVENVDATRQRDETLLLLAASREACDVATQHNQYLTRRLLAQTEQLVARTQAETAELATLVDTVQSSHFWRLKSWIGRLLRSH
jgi:O-antigen biosynthesis protein